MAWHGTGEGLTNGGDPAKTCQGGGMAAARGWGQGRGARLGLAGEKSDGELNCMFSPSKVRLQREWK